MADMTIDRDEKIHWFRVIVDISCGGYTAASIGAAIGMSKSTVLNWKQGADPRFEEGLRLIDLWKQVTGKGQESVPKIKRNSFLA